MRQIVAETWVFYKRKTYVTYLAALGAFKVTCLYVIGALLIQIPHNFLVVVREDAPFATSAFVVIKRLKSAHSTKEIFKVAKISLIRTLTRIESTLYDRMNRHKH